jgi:hypothetical protein
MKFERLLATCLCVLACACGGDAKKVQDTCATSVSYETVGEPFLERNCLRCHGEDVGAALGGGHVFGSEAELAEHGHDVYEAVESGVMPKGGPALPEAEKRAFLDWLECSGHADAESPHSH